MADGKTSGAGRTRVWTFLVYADSAPENWRDLLDENHIEWCESPYHENDVNPDGTPKKPHWHVVLNFDGVKTYEQVRDLIAPLNGPIPQRVQSIRGMVRYCAHLDNPEKAQYSPDEILAHGGFDLRFALQPTASQRYLLLEEMCEYVKTERIMELQDLMDYARIERREDWWPILCDSSQMFMDRYIKSQRHRQHTPVAAAAAQEDES